MTSTESNTVRAGQVRKTAEESLTAWGVGSVEQYFQLVRQTTELNRNLNNIWAGMVASLYGSLTAESGKVATQVADQTETVIDLAAKQAEKAAQQEAVAIEQVEKEQARVAKQAERAAARDARATARAPYEGRPKAELSQELAARGLPKTGTIEQLIERLVSADSE